MRNLHSTQKKLLDLLKKKKGSLEDLSLRDIGEMLDVGRKPQVVSYHLNQLERMGILREKEAGKRSYIILDSPAPSVAYINLYSCTAECGPEGFLGHDTIVDKIPLPTKTFGITDPKEFFLIRARGKSMEPMIKEDDLVLAKEQQTVPSGSIAVVVHEDMPKIKKVLRGNVDGQFTYSLVSLNNGYPTEHITDETEGLRIVGIVKGIIRKPKIDSV